MSKDKKPSGGRLAEGIGDKGQKAAGSEASLVPLSTGINLFLGKYFGLFVVCLTRMNRYLNILCMWSNGGTANTKSTLFRLNL